MRRTRMKQMEDSTRKGRRKERNISNKKRVWRAALGPRDALSIGKFELGGHEFPERNDRSLPYLLNKTLSFGHARNWKEINQSGRLQSSSLPDVPFSVSCRVL